MGRAEATDVRGNRTEGAEAKARAPRLLGGTFFVLGKAGSRPPHSTGMGRIGAEFAQEPLDTAYLYWRMLSLALSD